VPIHTNAYNGEVTGTRIFCYSKASKGYKAAHAIFDVLAPVTPGDSESVTVNASLYETRVPSAPTAYIEVDFHDVPEIATWLIESVEEIGEAICKGICNYFGKKYVAPEPPAPPKTYKVVLGEYATEAEAEAALGKIQTGLAAARKELAAAETLLGGAKVE
jgi:N-acetylmuramoyl-L-alanine amidase